MSINRPPSSPTRSLAGWLACWLAGKLYMYTGLVSCFGRSRREGSVRNRRHTRRTSHDARHTTRNDQSQPGMTGMRKPGKPKPGKPKLNAQHGVDEMV
jgi:hypothetical protein